MTSGVKYDKPHIYCLYQSVYDSENPVIISVRFQIITIYNLLIVPYSLMLDPTPSSPIPPPLPSNQHHHLAEKVVTEPYKNDKFPSFIWEIIDLNRFHSWQIGLNIV